MIKRPAKEVKCRFVDLVGRLADGSASMYRMCEGERCEWSDGVGMRVRVRVYAAAQGLS